jgi:hypothetical protein
VVKRWLLRRDAKAAHAALVLTTLSLVSSRQEARDATQNAEQWEATARKLAADLDHLTSVAGGTPEAIAVASWRERCEMLNEQIAEHMQTCGGVE